MRSKLAILIALCLCCLLAAAPAVAADVFKYEDRALTVFEGDMVNPVLLREGKFEQDGEITYTVNNKKICTVDQDGTITALVRGSAVVTATLKQNGRVMKKATIQITVARRVTKVTLSTKGLQVYEPDDEEILPLVNRVREEEKEELEVVGGQDTDESVTEPEEEAEPLTDRIIVLPVGKRAKLSAVCTPEDATSKRISFETDDVGIAKITSAQELMGIQRGTCQLTVRSVQNPEVTETFLVFVTEPAKKVTIEAPFNNVSVGESMQLDAIFTPVSATIQKVTWSSRSPKVASVDENGVVTGLARGRVTIDARAEDGSDVIGSVTLNVIQDVTEIVLSQTEATVATGRSVQMRVNVLPQTASDKTVTWTSSDESIATVRNGQITGRKAGDCVVTCTSNSNPAVSASVYVNVIQLVTKISFRDGSGVSFPIYTTYQLEWDVLPADASITEVTFRSMSPKIATVDQDGLVTGVSKGQAKIVATAADGSNRQATIVVTVTQPVEGIELAADTVYVQRGRTADLRASVLPKNANNQKVTWISSNSRIATVRTVGTSTGRVTGVKDGIVVLTAVTDDGGYTATAEAIVDDFDAAVWVEGAWIDKDNRIRLVLRNAGNYTVKNISFRIDCYDTQGKPMVCNKDGQSTFFVGSYPLEVQPGDRTQHGQFNFSAYEDNGNLGYVVITVTGYIFENDQKWVIPEDEWVPSMSQFSSHWGEQTLELIDEMEHPEERFEEELDLG